MKSSWSYVKLIICFFLLGDGQSAFSAVRNHTADLEAAWKHYLTVDAHKNPTKPFPFKRCFKSAAQEHDLPLSLILAVARGESGFNPNAKSDRNCHGLMQILWPETAKHLGIYRLSVLYDPCTNIRAGAKYLRELLDHYHQNLHLALAAYNYGPNRIDNALRSGGIPAGANWYSGYIYHHLGKLMHGTAVSSGSAAVNKPSSYIRQKRIPIITFSSPFRAAGFYEHLRKQAPDLNIEWYRQGARRYQVVLRYTDKQSLKISKIKLRRLGLRLK